MLESLAEAAHEVFCEGHEEPRLSIWPKNDDKLKTRVDLIPYAELPAD